MAQQLSELNDFSNTSGGSDFKHLVSDEIKSALKKLGRINLLLVGKTGTGKSTLVNAIFGDEVASTGVGRPVTRGLQYYEVPNKPLGLYDSEGFEVGESSDDLLTRLREIVDEKRQAGINRQIHAVWYCLRWSDRRFEDGQAAFVKELQKMDLPVLLVLTQVPMNAAGEVHPDAQALAEDIEGRNLGIAPTGRVLQTNAVADDFSGLPVHGLQKLLDATFLVVPEAVRAALTAAQQIDLDRKHASARVIIYAAATAAAAAAAVPIPIADTAAIVPIQATMIARISAIYGFPVGMQTLASLASAAFLHQGVSTVAKMAVRSLLSWVPGVNVAVKAIQAGVAFAFTSAVGEAWIAVCDYLQDKDVESIAGLVDSPVIRDLFLDSFKLAAKQQLAKD